MQIQHNSVLVRLVWCSFDAEQSSQYQDFLDKVRECGNSQEAAEDEDEDLVMERGNDLAPNRTCPLCQKEVGGCFKDPMGMAGCEVGTPCCFGLGGGSNYHFNSQLIHNPA